MAKVFLLCGKVCSGKTVYAHKLCNAKKACLLSVDEETLNVTETEQGTDSDEQVRIIKLKQLNRSLKLISKGKNVVLDWGFWTKRERKSVKEFYKENSIDLELHYICISDDLWNRRIDMRNALVLSKNTKAYFVDAGLKDKCKAMFEEPLPNEVDLIIYEE